MYMYRYDKHALIAQHMPATISVLHSYTTEKYALTA